MEDLNFLLAAHELREFKRGASASHSSGRWVAKASAKTESINRSSAVSRTTEDCSLSVLARTAGESSNVAWSDMSNPLLLGALWMALPACGRKGL